MIQINNVGNDVKIKTTTFWAEISQIISLPISVITCVFYFVDRDKPKKDIMQTQANNSYYLLYLSLLFIIVYIIMAIYNKVKSKRQIITDKSKIEDKINNITNELKNEITQLRDGTALKISELKNNSEKQLNELIKNIETQNHKHSFFLILVSKYFMYKTESKIPNEYGSWNTNYLDREILNIFSKEEIISLIRLSAFEKTEIDKLIKNEVLIYNDIL